MVSEYAPGFAIYALLVNVLDDFIIPLALALLGHPVLGGMAFAFDLDWLTYPAYFAALHLWRTARRK